MLLPDFVIGESVWSGHLSTELTTERAPKVYTDAPTCHLVGKGLIVHYKKTISGITNLSLNLTYTPSTHFEDRAEIFAKFLLKG